MIFSTIPLTKATAIFLSDVNRRLARIGIPFRVDAPLFWLLYSAILALALLTAVFTGIIIGLTTIGLAEAMALVSLVGVLGALLSLGSYPKLRRALLSPPSWRIYANAGISARFYAATQLFFASFGKFLLLFLPILAFLSSALLTRRPAADERGPLVIFGLNCMLTVVLAYLAGVSVLAARFLFRYNLSPDRAYRRSSFALTGLFAATAGIAAFLAIGRGLSSPPHRLTFGSLAARVYGMSHALLSMTTVLVILALFHTAQAFRRLGKLLWARIVEAQLPALAAFPVELTLPGDPRLAVIATDMRRLARSAGTRLNRFVVTLWVMLGSFVFLLGASRLFGTAIGAWLARLPEAVPGIIVGALAAGGIFNVHSSLAAVFHMDADRSAYKLWLTVPYALRRVAVTRAAVNSLVLLTVSVPIIFCFSVLVAVEPASYFTVFADAAAIIVLPLAFLP